jgi:aminotransferase
MARQVKNSFIRIMMDKAKEMEEQGRTIVHLELGEPDFTTPKPIIEATVRALREGHTYYAPDQGIDELRHLVAKKLLTEKGLKDQFPNVIITAGASEALFLAFMGLTGPGQSVLIPEPAFGNYYNCAVCAGSDPVHVPLKLANKCELDLEKLEAAIDDTTGFIMLNNPHNPTGGTFAPAQIEQLADLAIRKNLIVITDEIYEDIYYGEKPLSIATIDGMQERTILVGGFSKTYAMTGWRVGYIVAPPPFYDPIQKIHQYAVTCVSTFSQIGIANSLDLCDAEAHSMQQEYNKRREFLMEKLDEMNVSYVLPEGAFYLFINIEKFGLTSLQVCERLLEEHGLAILPGSSFGPTCEGYIRISYATSLEELAKAMVILKDFIANLH